MNTPQLTLAELIKTVEGILDVKKKIENSSMLEDILSLEDLINKQENSMFNPVSVDHKLRNKYEMIETIENVVSSNTHTNQNSVQKDWHDIILMRLKNDLVGIYVEIAIKHNIIDSYDKIDFTNTYL